MEFPEIIIVREPITLSAVQALAKGWHGNMVKGVADCRRGIMALGGEWHMDANVCLLKDGSAQEDLWGFSIYPAERGGDALDYLSLINIRPTQGNYEMELGHPEFRNAIRALVLKYLPDLPL